MRPRPVVLCVLDGFGLSDRTEGNAIRLAKTPRMTAFGQRYPSCKLLASGRDVGLPKGLMGNSEVGHLNLGAGRVVWQDIARIDRDIDDGDFFRLPALLASMKHALDAGTAFHMMGLVSDGGVHSSDRHYAALLDLARQQGLPADRVFVHAFLDGRDTPPKSGVDHVHRLVEHATGKGRVVTVVGRYYAMDRDKRWERVAEAYHALLLGEGYRAADPAAAVEQAYARGETDEFVKPTCIVDPSGRPLGRFRDGDSVFFFNFRADRAREITRAVNDETFDGFPRRARVKVNYATMTRYEETFTYPKAYAPEYVQRPIGQTVSERGLTQLRIAETEKYAHVTYFFSGGDEKALPGEERLLIQSPKVATYDLKPEMSAPEVASKTVEAIQSGKFDLVVLNFANPDMVGHTGVLPAAIQAVEVIDACVGRVADAALRAGGAVLLTSDHGNCEVMIDPATGGPHTAHTTNPVPLTLISEAHVGARLRDGALCDVAPTLLTVMGIERTAEMSGKPLL